jgi:hypothetical protein
MKGVKRMANMTSYLEEALLDHVFMNTEFVRPGATLYVGILTNDAAEEEMESGTDSGNAFASEIAGYTGGIRKAVTFEWMAPRQQGGKATIVNAADIIYENMPAAHPTEKIKYAFVCTGAGIGANYGLYWCPLLVEKEWTENDTFKIPAGALVIDLD